MGKVITAISTMVTITALLLVSGSLTAAGAQVGPAFWSVRDTASFLGVTEATVRYWSYMGSGPPVYKIGRYLKFKPDEVQEWADGQLQQPDSHVQPTPAPVNKKTATAAKRSIRQVDRGRSRG